MKNKKYSPTVPAVSIPAQPDISASAFAPRGLPLPKAAEYSGLTVWTLRNLIWDRKIPFLQVGRAYLILRDDIDSYLNSQKFKVRA
jgi:excisionase family DNA binding protein